MDRELMRCMLPERPPVGYEDWILREAKEDLRLDFLLYSAERVKVYPQLKAYMEPKDFEPIKSIWQTRCTCTACGEDFVTHHIKNGFTLYSGPDGCLYPVDPVNFDPCDCDAEDYGYDCQFVELSDNDTIACPMCDSEVSVIHSSRMHSRTRNALGCSVQNIGSYTAIIFWLTAHRIDRYGLEDLKKNPIIPDSLREQLMAEASAKASDQIRAEMQGQIDAAQQEAKAAAEARDAAEKAVREATAQLVSVKKSAALSNPDVLAFNLLGKQTVENINKLSGYYIKVSAADPDMGEKMKEYLLKLSAAIRVKAEGKKAE